MIWETLGIIGAVLVLIMLAVVAVDMVLDMVERLKGVD